MMQWGDLFTARQKASLVALGGSISALLDKGGSYATSLVVGRMVDFLVSLARWKADAECPVQALARQALPITWDFAETNPWTEATGSVISQASRAAHGIESVCVPTRNIGQLQPADAADHPLPSESAEFGLPIHPITTLYPMQTYPTSSWYGSSAPCRTIQGSETPSTQEPTLTEGQEAVQDETKLNAGRAKTGIGLRKPWQAPSPRGGGY